jgi:hypothetical protein
MKNIKMLLFSLIILLTAKTNLFSQQYWDEYDFQLVLKAALNSTKEIGKRETEDGFVYGIGDEIQDLSSNENKGSWSFSLVTTANDWFGTLTSYYAPTVVTNYGDHFQIIFTTIPLNELLIDRIDSEIDDDKVEFRKEFPDVSIEFGKYDSRITAVAEYKYKNKNQEELYELLRDLLTEFSNGIHYKSAELKEGLRDDLLDELEDEPVKYLTKDLLLLLDPGYKRFEKEKESTKEGYFSWVRAQTQSYHFYNYGDSVICEMWEYVVKMANERERNEILAELQAREYDDMVVDWFPGYEQEVIMFYVTFVFDGSITYGELVEKMDYLFEDYFPEIWYEMENIQDDVMDW